MAERSVDELRAELRSLGYLTHGIERWFALDPWSSRTFWAELAAVSSKAAVLVAFFAALPLAAIMAIRNQPLSFQGVALLFGLYISAAAVANLLLVVLLALILRSRPTLAIDSPAALTGMSLGLASVVALGILVWWSGFGASPSSLEVAVGGSLVILFLTVSALVFSAALLSFSIHEAKRIPPVAQKDRTIPLSIVAVIAAMVIGVWAARAGRSVEAEAPLQVVVAPTGQRVALLAVDGMTWDLFSAQRPDDLALTFATPLNPYHDTRSSAERWASLGTGTRPSLHLVRAIEGVQLSGNRQILQSVSTLDFTIDGLAVPLGIARRVPLPPTVRRRDYIWEIIGERGVNSVAVNWWVTDDERSAGLSSVSQSTIFTKAAGENDDPVELALAIDRIALETMAAVVEDDLTRFATAYLPASDIVLNRLALDPGARVAASIRAAAGVFDAARALENAGWDIVIVGMPGEGADASAVLASTLPAGAPPSLDTVAPTLLTLMGFPTSEEMSSALFVETEPTSRIASYGDREASSERAAPSNEYYESLKSLGYIR